MKVCTDACIFGAYVARQFSSGKLEANNILDIGTGTGLLSLMVAQKTNAAIDAIEIDEAAFHQARDNFDQSPWRERLNIVHTDALLFGTGKKYDCIISNPPFFEDDLRSANATTNAAKHDTTLTLEQLLTAMAKHLSRGGFFAVLLPVQRTRFFIESAVAANYYLNEQLLIRHSREHPFFRSILFFSHNDTTVESNELAIKNETGKYTPEFVELLKDYYLHL